MPSSRASETPEGTPPDAPARPNGPTIPLLRDSKGRPYAHVENVVRLLSQHPDWDGIFAGETFGNQRLVLRPPPRSPEPKMHFRPRPLRDVDVLRAQTWLNRNGLPRVATATVHGAIDVILADNEYDALDVYLNGVVWDGVPRLDTWLVDYADAENTPLNRAIGRAWLISAVARGLMPGCKVDHVLILEGLQGLGKSSLLAALVPNPDWFGDALPDMHSRQAMEYLFGKWIIELSELTAMRRSDVEAVKAFVTRTAESFRPAYGREMVHRQRRCAFAGSTNHMTYLKDSTGNRRYWPVRCYGSDPAGLASVRDQLWAEAVAAFRAGESWWLDAEMEMLAQQEQAIRVEIDPWAAAIAEYTLGKDEVSPTELADVLLGIPRGQIERRHTLRIADCLQQLGWERDGLISTGKYKATTRYRRK